MNKMTKVYIGLSICLVLALSFIIGIGVLIYKQVDLNTLFFDYIFSANQPKSEDVEATRIKMEEALKDKYGMEFVVEIPELTGNEGFGYDISSARAYPVKNKELNFSVNWIMSEDRMDFDTYISAKMSNELMKIWRPKLNKVYGKDYVIFSYSAGFSSGSVDKMHKELQNMTVEEILKKYPEKFNFSLSVCRFIDSFDDNKEADKIVELTQWFNGKPINVCQYSTFIFNKKNRQVAMDWIEDKDKRTDDELYGAGKLIDAYILSEPFSFENKDAVLKSLWYKNHMEENK